VTLMAVHVPPSVPHGAGRKKNMQQTKRSVGVQR